MCFLILGLYCVPNEERKLVYNIFTAWYIVVTNIICWCLIMLILMKCGIVLLCKKKIPLRSALWHSEIGRTSAFKKFSHLALSKVSAWLPLFHFCLYFIWRIPFNLILVVSQWSKDEQKPRVFSWMTCECTDISRCIKCFWRKGFFFQV